MSSSRNILFLALTAGIGIAAFLFANGMVPGTGRVYADDVPMVGRTTAGEALPGRPSGEPNVGEATGLVEIGRSGIDGGAQSGSDAPGSTTVVWPLEVELTQVLQGAIDGPDDLPPIRGGANAAILGSVLGVGGRPLPSTITFTHGLNRGRTLQTDSRGRFGASDLQPGLSVVLVKTQNGDSAEREVRLQGLAKSEFNLSFAYPSTISGTVKDERGAPVGGAEVQMDGRLQYTNDEGVFTFSSVAAGKVLMVIEKEGFALAKRVFSLGMRSNIKPEDLPIVLTKGASLQISVQQSGGAAEPSLAVITSTGSGGHNFPWFRVSPQEIPAGGSVTVTGLPPESVNIRVFHRGAVPKPSSQNVSLQASRPNAVTIALAAAPSVQGLVMDDGEPVGRAIVTIEAADRTTATSKAIGLRNPRKLLDAVVPVLPAAFDQTVTDGKGRFTFTTYPELLTTYYVTARSADGKRSGVNFVRSEDTKVVVELDPVEDALGAIELDLPGRFQALPIELKVDGAPRDLTFLRPGVALNVPDLPHGTWRVMARWRGQNVVMRKLVEVGDSPGKVTGTLPKGAIEGQTADVRARAQREGTAAVALPGGPSQR